MKKILLMVTLFLAASAWAEESTEGQDENPVGSVNLIKSAETQIKSPLKLRDPFKRKLLRKSSGTQKSFTVDKSNFSNREMMGKVSLAEIKIVGVLVGNERRAMAKLGSDKTFILKEGMLLGENGAEIKAIMPGGIVLVEKITNVYDEIEYLETVIPISN